MKKIEVVLLSDIASLGKTGDVVRVSGGYAKNALFSKKLARIATSNDTARARSDEHAAGVQQMEIERQRAALAVRLRSEKISFERPANDHGKLFGSVKAEDIVAALAAKGLPDVTKEMLRMQKPFDQVGDHQVICDISPTNRVTVAVTIQPRVGKT